jgi:hypothetical protein
MYVLVGWINELHLLVTKPTYNWLILLSDAVVRIWKKLSQADRS